MKKILVTILSWTLALSGTIILAPVTIGTWLLLLSKMVYCYLLQDHTYNYTLLAFGVTPETLQCTICGKHASQQDIEKIYVNFAPVIEEAIRLQKQLTELQPKEEPYFSEKLTVVTTQKPHDN